MEQVYAVSRVVLVRGSAAWKEIVGLFYKRGRKHGLTFTDFL